MANALIHHVGAIIKRILTWASNDRATLTVTLNGVDVPSGSKVRKGKALTVRAASKTGYQDAVASANGVLIANDTLIMGKENTTITVDAIPTVYSLTTSGISQYNNVTINRSSVGGPGTYAGATTKNNMTSEDNVYYGDGLSFSQSPDIGFTGAYSVINNGETVINKQTTAQTTNVDGNIVVSSVVTAKPYTLSTSGVNSNYVITVKRSAVGTPGSTVPVSASTDPLADNSKVYYGDTLSFSGSVGSGYTGSWSKSGVDNNNKVTGDVTVSSSVTKIQEHPNWMTNYYTLYSWTNYSSSNTGQEMSHSASIYTTTGSLLAARIVNTNTMEVYHGMYRGTGSNTPAITFKGIARKITSAPVTLTGKTKISVTLKVNSSSYSSSTQSRADFGIYYSSGNDGSTYSNWHAPYSSSPTTLPIGEVVPTSSSYGEIGGLDTTEGKTVTMTRTLKNISGDYYLMLYLHAGGSESTTSAYSSLQTSITILNVVLS